MRVLEATESAIEEAAQVLGTGGLVAFPTETVYGLGALATDVDAVGRVFAAKGRPAGHPLIVHLPSPGALADWAVQVPEPAQLLAAACWPGPLTLVVRRSSRVPDAVTGGRDTVGLRVPAQPVALALLERVGSGVAAPSANRFGRVSPTAAAHVVADLGADVDLVLDGGPCSVGVESTIVEVLGGTPSVLRVGGVPVERLRELLGGELDLGITGPARAPGMLAAHYAPAARVVTAVPEALAEVLAAQVAGGRAVALLGPPADPGTVPEGVVVLDPVGDPESYARSLYQRLREADRVGADVVVAVLPPAGGLGTVVRDRLRRAEAAGT